MDDLTVAEVAAGVRRLLTAITDGELACSAAYRNRLEGAVLALEALAAGSPGDDFMTELGPPVRGGGRGSPG